MQKPLVSIIMPVYNMGEHLRKSVPSVLNQTYQNIELILVDDGSKDNSLEVCRELAVKDNRIKVFHQDNQGSGPARNTGIKNAAGKYAYFPDADDCMVPNAIESLIEKFEKYSCDMLLQFLSSPAIFTIFSEVQPKLFSRQLSRLVPLSQQPDMQQQILIPGRKFRGQSWYC